MLGISKHADFHFGPRNVGQFDRATETLVLLGVVVLESNLELNSLCELAILLLGICNNHSDCFPEGLTLKLTAVTKEIPYQHVTSSAEQNNTIGIQNPKIFHDIKANILTRTIKEYLNSHVHGVEKG